MPERVKGVLEKFCLTPGKAEAFVRVGNALLHMPMVNRGILQPDKSIKPCVNGQRYQALAHGSQIELDVDDAKNSSPFVVLWAPRP